MVLSRNERKIRYSIRKFSIGVASVAVCCFFCASVAQAAENEGATQTAVSSKVVEDSLKTQKTKLLPDEAEVTDPNELDDIKNAFGQGNNAAPQPGGQPSIPNQVGSESMPPTTSGETGSLTKPKTSNDSMKSLERELKEAKETAKTTLDNYRKSRLTQLNPAAFWFGDLLLATKKTLSEYSAQFDRASSKEEVKALMEKSKQEIDKLIVTHQNREKGNQPAPQPGGTPSGSSTDKPSGTPEVGNQSDKPAPSLSDTKEVQDLIKKGFQELEKLEKSLQELDEKAELPDEEFYGKQKTIWDNQKSTIQKSIKDFKDIVKDIASKYHKENYFKKYNSDFKDYQLYVQMEMMTRQVRDYLLRYPKDGDIIKEFESGMKQTASDNYSNLSGDNLKGYFEKNFRSAFEKIQEIVRKLEKKAPAPKTPEKPQKSEQPTPSKPQVKSPVQKVFTTQNGNTKITVMFETATEADSINLKEVTTKEMIDNVTRQTGQGTVRIFDISLSKDGKETHVKGERVVRLAIGNIDSEIQVYHVKENGELELLPSTVENGQVVFKTSHFSLFAIKTLPKKQMSTEPEANREGKTQSDDKEMVLLADKANQMSENRSNSDKKDKQALPSTGTMSTLLMEFLGLISLVGVYLLKGKKTEND